MRSLSSRQGTGWWRACPAWLKCLFFAAAALLLAALAFGAWYGVHVGMNHRFKVVEVGRFYRSGAMPVADLEAVVRRHGIRTVVDLRRPMPGGAEPLEMQAELDAESAHLERLGVRWVHIPSRQLPSPEIIERFLDLLDDPATYPVLVHCRHGKGRAEIFTALYRIEVLGWEPEQARRATRLAFWKSSFAPDGPKGRFISSYRPRRSHLPADRKAETSEAARSLSAM